jgi:uncharacterized protein YndB with AHSA1/START domain
MLFDDISMADPSPPVIVEDRKTIKQLVLASVTIVAVAGLALVPLPLHDRTRIVNAIIIARPPEAVFASVTTPGNWPKWHPASLAVSGTTDHSLVPGERVTEDFLVAGRKGKVVWTAQKRDAPRAWVIEGDIDGHDAGVIAYTLTAVAEGTRFEREFVYDSPNLLFAVLNRLSMRTQVESESAQAVQNLKRLLEAPH